MKQNTVFGQTDARMALAKSTNVVIPEGVLCIERAAFEDKQKRVEDIEQELARLKTQIRGNHTTESKNEINGHEYVDLGLSVKWATCNVGANSPEENGDYYAWGEITSKTAYSKKNYTGKDILMDISGNAEYDAACAKWGGTWRMPTAEEIDELIDKCTWTWTRKEGYCVCEVTGPNGNSIFLPAAGCRHESSLDYAGFDGRYWSSTPDESDGSYSYGLCFYSSSHSSVSYGRVRGRSVRPVSE